MRKISKTLALMSLLAPFGADALGIGGLRLNSALNQSLNAEIPLVTSGSDELSGLRVTLASAEAFSRAGIERSYFLTKLRFTPQQKADGSYVIKVSSQEAIREPFLNFMIDVHWPQGRVQREFTVLLDPPASFQEESVSDADLPEAEVPSYQPAYEPEPIPIRRTAVARQRPVQPRPRPIEREARSIEAPPSAPPGTPISGSKYGPVSQNETLWSIAKRYNNDSSISQQQMLTAIYKANPQAFFRNSLDALKAGETITIPDRETISRLVGGVPAASTRNAGTQSARLQPRRTANIPQVSTANQDSQLTLLAPGESKSKPDAASNSGKPKQGKVRDDIALEVADTVKQENDDIRKRLAEFEQQLSSMQRLLSLKEEQIANLQNQQKLTGKEPPPQHTSVQPTVQTPQPPARVSPIAPPISNLDTDKKTADHEAEKPLPRIIPAVPPTKPTPAKLRPTQQLPVQPQNQEKNEFTELLEENYGLIGAAAGLLLLGGALWLIKRRRAAMVDDTESILTLTSKERAPLEKRPTSAILKVDSPSHISEQTSTSRSSFLSEFTPSDFDALGGEMEEVDPISEADVYLAYGRYKQAEELIRNAINQNPENDECKLKLLEIHYSTENAEAFETFAQELEPTHRLAKPSFWDKVDEMGRELCPDSPLFFDQSQSLPIGENVVELSKLVSSDKSRTVDKPSIKDALPDEIFTYPSFEKTTPTPEIADETDLSLDNYSLFEQPIEGEEIETLILDADSGKVHEPPQHSQASGPNKPQEKTLDDVFAEIARLSGTSDADTEYLDSETLPAQSENILRDKSSSSTIEFEPLSEMDEHETKLDLAKAYFEMGDDEAARLILENVVQQGNETQKEEAWSLLKILNRQEANSRG